MYEIITVLLGLLGMFAVVGGIAYFLQNRAKKIGNLFTQPISRFSRILAFIFALVFAGVFLIEFGYSDRYHVILPFISFFLLAYSLGFNRFVEAIQKKDK